MVFTALKTREPPSRTKRAVAVVAPGPCSSPDGKQQAEAPRHRTSGSFRGHSLPAGGRDVPEARHQGFRSPGLHAWAPEETGRGPARERGH